MNLAGIPAASERIAQYPDPASMSNCNNLAVPMTPLHHNNSGDSESGRSGAHQLKGILAATNSGGHNNHIMASSIQTCIPATPLSVNPNIPMPTLQNIVSTVNLGPYFIIFFHIFEWSFNLFPLKVYNWIWRKLQCMLEMRNTIQRYFIFIQSNIKKVFLKRVQKRIEKRPFFEGQKLKKV